MTLIFEKIGRETLWVLESAGRMGLFLALTLFNIFRPPYKLAPIIHQIHFIGAR